MFTAVVLTVARGREQRVNLGGLSLKTIDINNKRMAFYFLLKKIKNKKGGSNPHVRGLVNGQSVAYPHNGTLFNLEKKCKTL